MIKGQCLCDLSQRPKLAKFLSQELVQAPSKDPALSTSHSPLNNQDDQPSYPGQGQAQRSPSNQTVKPSLRQNQFKAHSNTQYNYK